MNLQRLGKLKPERRIAVELAADPEVVEHVRIAMGDISANRTLTIEEAFGELEEKSNNRA